MTRVRKRSHIMASRLSHPSSMNQVNLINLNSVFFVTTLLEVVDIFDQGFAMTSQFDLSHQGGDRGEDKYTSK